MKFLDTISVIVIIFASPSCALVQETLDMSKYYVLPGYCTAQSPKTVATFSHYFGQMPLPVVDDALGVINIS